MNRVYKIVWSKAKNAYVVTSELAKNHTKNASGKMVKAALTAAVGMGVLMGGYMADAAPATNPSGDGPGIAICKDLDVFAKSSWRIVLVSVVVFIGTYIGSAIIAQVILKSIGQI